MMMLGTPISLFRPWSRQGEEEAAGVVPRRRRRRQLAAAELKEEADVEAAGGSCKSVLKEELKV